VLQTVYRIENEDGIGPYAAYGAFWVGGLLQGEYGENFSPQPTPLEDAGIERHMIEDNEFCGFASMEQLLQWFPESALEILEDEGFKVVELQVEVTATGEHQVLFVREPVLT